MTESHPHRPLPTTLAVLLLGLGLLAATPAATDVTVEEGTRLLAASDPAAEAPESFRMRLGISRTGQEGSTEVAVTRDPEGRVLVEFLDERQEGKRLVQRSDGLWLISPGASQPVRIDPSVRLWGGLSLDEVLGIPYSELYTVVEATRPAEGLVQLELEAASEQAPYPTVRYVLREDTERPVRIEHRVSSGKVATLLEIPEWTADEPRRPKRLVVKDVLRNRPPTEVEILEMEPVDPNPDLFALPGRSEGDASER